MTSTLKSVVSMSWIIPYHLCPQAVKEQYIWSDAGQRHWLQSECREIFNRLGTKESKIDVLLNNGGHIDQIKAEHEMREELKFTGVHWWLRTKHRSPTRTGCVTAVTCSQNHFSLWLPLVVGRPMNRQCVLLILKVKTPVVKPQMCISGETWLLIRLKLY